MSVGRFLISFFVFSISFNAFSISSLESLFADSFHSHYKKGRCGDNILELVKRAQENDINLKDAKILEIVNKGNSVLGLVNVEYAREGGRVDPNSLNMKPYRYFAGERNWYHHVVLELDGFIFDFDFDNRPRVVSVREYFEVMFFEEKRENDGGSFYVGRDEKLRDYEITSKNALLTLKARIHKKEAPVGQRQRFREFLQNY